MNSSLAHVLRRAARLLLEALGRAVREQQSSAEPRREAPASRREAPVAAHGGTPSPYGAASARELDDRTLPQFDYAPHEDGDADPGEVVWTWVPYEDVPEVGKDRPVLVLARLGEDVVVLQLTSKDHDRDAADEARFGRYWFEIGSGDWDRRGRTSEVRIDRLLRVGQAAIRREGGVLDRRIFEQVIDAVRDAHRRGL